MIRKLLIGSILLSTGSIGNAMTGFYVGGGLGPDIANVKVTSHVFQPGMHGFNVKNDNQLSATGLFGTIFAGYGKKLSDAGRWNNVYLGGELNANLSSLEHQDSNDEFVHQSFSRTTYKMPYSFGASFIPGYVYNDNTLFYGRLGYANGNFKVSTTDASLTNTHKNLSGFRWGLGLQRMITTQVAIRMDYSNVSYNSTTVHTVDSLSAVSKKTQFTPHVNEVAFGLVYCFC